LKEMLVGLADTTPVFVALGKARGQLNVASVSQVVEMKEPLEGAEVLLIVPMGVLPGFAGPESNGVGPQVTKKEVGDG
jgi:hypothetical protein